MKLSVLKNKSNGGFTLIELMITVAILGILASIAYPSYTQYVQQTRRAVAQADLVELAAYMERYYTENFTYASAALPFNESPKDAGTKYYDLAASNLSTTTFTLTATPKNGQDADSCGTMTFNQAGTKTAATTGCWQ